MGISVDIVIYVLIMNEFVIISGAQQQNCIPAQYCGLVWTRRLICCDADKLTNCGREKKLYANARILGDEEAAVGEFPWMVQIFYRYLNTSQCSGSLITRQFVLTAAHCVAKRSIQVAGKPSFVRLGEHNLKSRFDCVKRSYGLTNCSKIPNDIKILSYFMHPEYIEASIYRHNDISILKLEKIVKFTDLINTICLPVDPIDISNDRLKFVVSGWGETRKGIGSHVKLKVTVPNYDFLRCAEFYKNKTKIILNDGQLCAGGRDGYDSCRGDSGGPLMFYNERKHRWILVGIVSFGAKRCGTLNFPAVYNNVQKYLEWITNNIKD